MTIWECIINNQANVIFKTSVAYGSEQKIIDFTYSYIAYLLQ